MFDEFGEIWANVDEHEMFYFDADSFDNSDDLNVLINKCVTHSYLCLSNNATRTTVKCKPPEYSKLQPYFS